MALHAGGTASCASRVALSAVRVAWCAERAAWCAAGIAFGGQQPAWYAAHTAWGAQSKPAFGAGYPWFSTVQLALPPHGHILIPAGNEAAHKHLAEQGFTTTPEGIRMVRGPIPELKVEMVFGWG